MVSADGHCRPFDASASGTIFGSGAGVVLLKRLEDAIADGDQIYAVILGCGLSNDGAGKVGFTAPSVDGQVAAIEQASRAGGHRRGQHRLRRVSRHRNAPGRSDRGRGAHQGVSEVERGASLLRYRVGEGQHRPPGCRRRCGWPDQDGPDAPQPRVGAEFEFRGAQPAHRVRRRTILRQRRSRSLAGRLSKRVAPASLPWVWAARTPTWYWKSRPRASRRTRARGRSCWCSPRGHRPR